MRTTELLCVFCLFLASAANKCDGDSSCIAEEDDASLLQSASKVKESSLTGRAGEFPDPDPELAESEAQESSVTDPAGDEEEGDAAGGWPADDADVADGGVEDPSEGASWDPSACSTELCTVCEACFQQMYNTSDSLVTLSNFASQCLGIAGPGQESTAEVCGIEDKCVGQGAQHMMKCVLDNITITSTSAQGQGAPTRTQIGNCMAEKMCDAGTAKICAVGTTVATNWHSMTCPTSLSLLEKKRNKQNKSVGQEISLDDSLSGKRTC